MVAGGALRIVFFGTPEFAVPTLDALVHSRHRVVGVVTQPDRPRGRGQKTTAGPVKMRAAEAGLVILQPERLKDPAFLESLEQLHFDLGVVAAYGKILTEAVLAVPRLGMVNVHASLLPRYRGAAPVHRAIMAGETETGVTIMRVVKALDAGPMLARSAVRIGPEDTSGDVERDLANRGADLLVSTLDAVSAGTVQETPQIESEATYASRLTKEEGLVDWNRTAVQIHNQIRGLQPWPHAFSFIEERRLILHRSMVDRVAAPDASAGTIVEAGSRLVVAAGTGCLELVVLQAEGKRPLSAHEFLAGHALAVGERFSSAAP